MKTTSSRKLILPLCEPIGTLDYHSKIISVDNNIHVDNLRVMESNRNRLTIMIRKVNDEKSYDDDILTLFEDYYDHWYIFQRVISN